MTYYDSGIGTYVKADGWSHRRIKQWFDNKTDEAIAWHVVSLFNARDDSEH